MSVKKYPKKFPNVRKFLGCSDKISEVNFSPAETLILKSAIFNFEGSFYF